MFGSGQFGVSEGEQIYGMLPYNKLLSRVKFVSSVLNSKLQLMPQYKTAAMNVT